MGIMGHEQGLQDVVGIVGHEQRVWDVYSGNHLT